MSPFQLCKTPSSHIRFCVLFSFSFLLFNSKKKIKINKRFRNLDYKPNEILFRFFSLPSLSHSILIEYTYYFMLDFFLALQLKLSKKKKIEIKLETQKIMHTRKLHTLAMHAAFLSSCWLLCIFPSSCRLAFNKNRRKMDKKKENDELLKKKYNQKTFGFYFLLLLCRSLSLCLANFIWFSIFGLSVIDWNSKYGNVQFADCLTGNQRLRLCLCDRLRLSDVRVWWNLMRFQFINPKRLCKHLRLMLLMMMASCGVVWLGLVMCVRECDGILKWIAALLITNSYNELHKSFVIKFQFIEYKYDLYTAFFMARLL